MPFIHDQDCSLPGSFVHEFSRQKSGMGAYSLFPGSSDPGIEPAGLCIVGTFFIVWTMRKLLHLGSSHLPMLYFQVQAKLPYGLSYRQKQLQSRLGGHLGVLQSVLWFSGWSPLHRPVLCYIGSSSIIMSETGVWPMDLGRMWFLLLEMP